MSPFALLCNHHHRLSPEFPPSCQSGTLYPLDNNSVPRQHLPSLFPTRPMGTASLGGSTRLSMPKSEPTLPLSYLLTPHLWPPGPRPMAHLDPPSPFPFPGEPILPSACLSSSHPPLFPSACGKVQALTLHGGRDMVTPQLGSLLLSPLTPILHQHLGFLCPGHGSH